MRPAPASKVWSFILRFALVFGLLMLPWPGVPSAYRAWIQGLSRMSFASDTGMRELSFRTAKSARSLMRVEIVNRGLMQLDGSGPVRNLEIDTGGFWRTTALLIALVVASPVSRRSRLRALLWGTLVLHAFILFGVGFPIWNESRHVSLMTLSPLWQSFADRLQQMVIAQFSIAAPFVIWILVTFRRSDLEGLRLGSSQPS